MSTDPLDEKSDVYVIKDGKPHDLTFRELQHEALLGEGRMALMDSLSAALRLKHEQANDPHYKPIEPNSGRRRDRPRHRPWRPVP